jgi:hypothetical protein
MNYSLPKKPNKLITKGGWDIIHIYGSPYERGYAHGYLLAGKFAHIQKVFEYEVTTEFKVSLAEYLRTCRENVSPIVKTKYPEFYEELQGIADGVNAKTTIRGITPDWLIAWNSFLSMYTYYDNPTRKSRQPLRCSAFIATGKSYTQNGDIVMAHNTHSDYMFGQIQNVMMYVYPSNGYSFLMQTTPGYICSGADWFLCTSGIIGCETTIADTSYDLDWKTGTPYFCRIRQAMQYAATLDEYHTIMITNNAGDYACSWLLGDTNTGEIMRIELGLKTTSVQRTNDGAYHGMNSAINTTLRATETTDIELYDTSTSSGARNSRLYYLLHEKYKGKITVDTAKKIIADHYDAYLGVSHAGPRGICSHKRSKKNIEYGAVDAKVVDTPMAKTLSTWSRIGPPCGQGMRHANTVKIHHNRKSITYKLSARKWIKITS